MSAPPLRQGELGSVPSVGPLSHAIFRVARLHKMFAGQLLRETGLYPLQELLMMRLWVERPQRQIDLVRSLDSDAPTMARTVARWSGPASYAVPAARPMVEPLSSRPPGPVGP